jgi:phenylacetaldehyde dehydrogenase
MSGWRAFVARSWAGKLPAERERLRVQPTSKAREMLIDLPCSSVSSWASSSPCCSTKRILLHFADLVEQHGEELAQLETLEQGKSINISRAFPAAAGWKDRGFCPQFWWSARRYSASS